MRRALRSLMVHVIATLAMLAVAACSSASGTSGSLPPMPQRNTGTSVAIRLIVADSNQPTSLATRRRPQFISAATLGVSLALTGSATVTVAVNISPGAAACGGSNSSPRTCSAALAVPAGNYSLTATSYDTAPSAGVIPGGAHILAQGTVTGITVTNGQANQTTVYLGGVITAIGNAKAYISLSATGSAQQIGIVFAPTDFANEPIIAGSNDPYHNPLTMTLSESNGSGHMTLIKNGTTVGASATLTMSSDSLQVAFDGNGSAGYSASLAVSASGVATVVIQLSPLYVTPQSYASGNSVQFTNAGETSTLAITEASAPASVVYTESTSSGCSSFATVTAVSGSGANASVTVSDASGVSASTCTLTFTDNVGSSTSVPITITSPTTNASVAIPGQIIEYSTGITAGSVPFGITTGASGDIWFTEHSGNRIGKLTLSTHAITEVTCNCTSPGQMMLGPDLDPWFTATVNKQIIEINPSNSALTVYNVGIPFSNNVNALTTTANGVVFGACSSAAQPLVSLYPSINLVQLLKPLSETTSPSFYSITTGPDGNVWWTDPPNNHIGVTNTINYTSTAYTVPTASATPYGITTGPDGNLWVAEYAADKIAKFNPTTATWNEYTTGLTAAAEPQGIIKGPDGNLYFAEYGASKIGRITTAGIITEFSTGMSSGANPGSLTVGGDGNIYFPEQGTNKIGELVL